VEDYARFRDRLEEMRYGARIATQQQTLQEKATSTPDAGTKPQSLAEPIGLS
jgi:hypothetical protein